VTGTKACAHARKYFYRAGWFAPGSRRPGVQVVERCQDCGADARGGERVPLQELREVWRLEPGMLEPDPWAESTRARAAGRGGRHG